MLKILIVGSSYPIKNIFAKKYEDHDIHYVGFRNLWKNRSITKFDIIILSGFHFEILKSNTTLLNNYINDYSEFISFLLKNSKKIFVISTFIPKNISYSRTVYFYFKLSSIIINNENINILSFKKINDDRFNKTMVKKFLDIFNTKFTQPDELIRNTLKFKIENLNNPSFFFLQIPRSKIIERFLRLLDRN